MHAPHSQISCQWQDPHATLPYTTGVSLHGHTSASEESLTFIHKMALEIPLVGLIARHYERLCLHRHGVTLDFLTAHWRPPLLPRMAFDVEYNQIASLGLAPLVSLTDHDTMDAPLLLRTIPIARGIPVSLEWTTPFGVTAFHLGIHNIPTAESSLWMAAFTNFTSAPSDAALLSLLRDLSSNPQILIVLNHPLWDLYKVGKAAHAADLDRFLTEAASTIHALELNGLRHARENREVAQLGRRTGHLLISGGDRHGIEANANINLSHARTFSDFVHEIRVLRRSHILFMPQYQKPWEERILGSTLDAITNHPQFSPGWQNWDERAFHQDAHGTMRPMSELWANGHPPMIMRLTLGFVRLFRHRGLAKALSLTCPGVNAVTIET